MLKAGDEKTYSVGGETLTLRAIPYGRLKKIVAVVAEVFDDITKTPGQNTAAVMRQMVDVIGQRVTVLFPLLFDPKAHPFMTAEWIEEYLTVPMAREIADDAMKINGLDDFFSKGGAARPAPAVPLETRPLVENGNGKTATISESPGSTTSVASPTDGAPAMSMS